MSLKKKYLQKEIKNLVKKPINFKLSRKRLKNLRIKYARIEYKVYMCFSELALNPVLVLIIRIVLVIIVGNTHSLANCIYDSVEQVISSGLTLHLYKIPLVDCTTSGVPYATHGFRIANEDSFGNV